MKTCDHCGTPAKRRYAVRITKDGHSHVAMVGSSCAKRFPRANQSDLIRATTQDRGQLLPANILRSIDFDIRNVIQAINVLPFVKSTVESCSGTGLNEDYDEHDSSIPAYLSVKYKIQPNQWQLLDSLFPKDKRGQRSIASVKTDFGKTEEPDWWPFHLAMSNLSQSVSGYSNRREKISYFTYFSQRLTGNRNHGPYDIAQSKKFWKSVNRLVVQSMRAAGHNLDVASSQSSQAGWRMQWVVEKPGVGSLLRDTFDQAKALALTWAPSLKLTKPMADEPDVYWDAGAGILIRRVESKQHRGYREEPGRLVRSDGRFEATRHYKHQGNWSGWLVTEMDGDGYSDPIPKRADAIYAMMSWGKGKSDRALNTDCATSANGYKIRISRDVQGLGLKRFRALVFIVNTETKDLIIGRMGHIDLLHEVRDREQTEAERRVSYSNFQGGRIFPLEGKVSFTSGTIRVVADADRSEVLAALEGAIGMKLLVVEPGLVGRDISRSCASKTNNRAALAHGYATPPKQLSEAEFFKLFPVAPHHKSNVFYAKWKGYGVAWSGGSKNKGWGKLSGPLVSFYDPYQKQWLETIFIDPDTLSPFPADKLSDPISYNLATEWLDTFRTWQPPPDEASSIRRFGGGHTFSKSHTAGADFKRQALIRVKSYDKKLVAPILTGNVFYHVSTKFLGKTATLNPKIPRDPYTIGGMVLEDTETPRVSFSTSIGGAVFGMSHKIKRNQKLFIYEARSLPGKIVPNRCPKGLVSDPIGFFSKMNKRMISDNDLKALMRHCVADIKETHEVWATRPVKVGLSFVGTRGA